MAKQQVISFHGNAEIKEAKIIALNTHKELDNLIQRTYFDSSERKGCAVTCTMFTPEEFASGEVDTSNIHARYVTELGIPRIIARLEDKIFEGLPVAESKNWPLDFMNAIPVGVDLENVWRKFMIWLLVDNTEGVIKYAKSEDSRKAIENIAAAFERSLVTEVSKSEWLNLRDTAYKSAAAAAAAAAASAYASAAAAASAYAYASASAAASAYASAAAAADADAASAAADAAAYAADASAAAAAAAAAAADADADADARRLAISQARDKARTDKFIKMSQKLIELLKAA
jgi:hypothetical protein